MGSTRKAVFLDVDGTYVNDRGLVPDSARKAVVRARRNGHRVFLCTGRSTSELWDDILDAGFDGVIAAAGGYVEIEGDVLAHRTVPVEHLKHAIGFFERHGIDYYLEANSGLYGSRDSRARLRELLYGSVRDEDILAELEKGLGGFIDSLIIGADPIRTDINKISFLDSDVSIETIRAEFAEVFDVIPATVPMFGPNSGEMAVLGVHKALAIAEVLDHLGLDRADTVAFGDGLNDLEMLEFVAVGVAMANAPDRVRAVASHVTGTADENGIWNGFAAHGLV